MSQDNVTSNSVGAFMVIMILVIEACKASGARTKCGCTIDFAALVQEASHGVLYDSSEESLSETDRELCVWLVAMFLDRIGSLDRLH